MGCVVMITIYVIVNTRTPLKLIKPHSYRIVRFMDRTIGCDWAKVRPIGNVSYDLQQRSHTAIDLYPWRISMATAIVGNRATFVATNDRCTINRDGRRPMVQSIDRCILRPIVRAIVASCDRSYEHSWHPVSDRTINRGTRRPMVRSIVRGNDRWHDQS